ncbi:MAG: hypothetical protein K8L91_02150 [Anaerolineae bacterium]|nr:hypothetical protein [Anaerolineae bacterium]
MGMMALIIAVGVAVFMVISFSAVVGVAATAKRKQRLMEEGSEKPKRGRFMLADDGELVGVEEDEPTDISKFKEP